MNQSRHYFLAAERRADRAAAVAGLPLPPQWLAPISANRRLRGPYAAGGALVRAIVPAALDRWPDLVTRHKTELLTIAPELREWVPVSQETLTSLAVPVERTRFYSALRTLRLAHGITEFIIEYLRRSGDIGGSVVIDDIHHADYTDQELLAVMLRRIDPALLRIVVCGTPDFGQLDEAESAKYGSIHPPFGKLDLAIERWCERVVPSAAATEPEKVSGDVAELAREYVASDGTDDRPELLAGYLATPQSVRANLHDERADQLAAQGEFSLTLGAIPWHRTRGSDLYGAGLAAVNDAMEHSMRMGFYDATIEFCEQGRALVDWEAEPRLWWTFTTKLPTSLSALGRGDEAEAICYEGRVRSEDPAIHHQVAYAMAMLFTRHLDAGRKDHEVALGWINQAIAIATGLSDPKERSFTTVFNRNGRALIEAHRGRPEVALTLVTDGLAQLDRDLAPDEHQLHRSVLRYNRAQVLVGMGRLTEALADYDAVIAIDPNYPEYHFDRGNLLHRLGRDEEALVSYNRAIELSPPFVEVFYNRADVLAGLGELEQAVAEFSHVLEIDPDYLDAYLNRAAALMDLNENELAAADVESGLALEPSNAHLLALKARLEMEAGRHEAARTAVDQALAADPGMGEAWAISGALYYTVGELVDSLADFDRAVELSPDASAIRLNRAVVSIDLGRHAEAETDLSIVIEGAPDYPDGWLERARCRHAAGNLAGAAADAEQFCELAPERYAEAAEYHTAGLTELAGSAATPR